MRLLTSLLALLMVLALAAGWAYSDRQARETEARIEEARRETARFQQEIHLRLTMSPLGERRGAFPESIDPEWFDGDLPRNPLLDERHPLIEVAADDHRDREHPIDLVAADPSVAAFWYNPANGIVRARVPVNISDEKMLRTYNRVNETLLTTLFPTN